MTNKSLKSLSAIVGCIVVLAFAVYIAKNGRDVPPESKETLVDKRRETVEKPSISSNATENIPRAVSEKPALTPREAFAHLREEGAVRHPVTERLDEWWKAGKREQVRRFGEHLIARDAKDFFGNVLIMYINFEKMDVDASLKSIDRVQNLGTQIESPYFVGVRPLIEKDIEWYTKILTGDDSSLRTQYAEKSEILGRGLPATMILSALEADGMVHEIDLQSIDTEK